MEQSQILNQTTDPSDRKAAVRLDSAQRVICSQQAITARPRMSDGYSPRPSVGDRRHQTAGGTMGPPDLRFRLTRRFSGPAIQRLSDSRSESAHSVPRARVTSPRHETSRGPWLGRSALPNPRVVPSPSRYEVDVTSVEVEKVWLMARGSSTRPKIDLQKPRAQWTRAKLLVAGS